MSKLKKLKSLIPIEEIEPAAMQQVYSCLDLPFLERLALMPDVHAGYDLPIGGIALLRDKISPSYVGFDIGCGMCLVDTGITAKDLHIDDERGKRGIFEKIYRNVPTGFASLSRKIVYPEFVSPSGDRDLEVRVNEKAQSQLGTLGSGNHFIEIGESGRGTVCITIHSGSRNVGHTIGGYYMSKGRFLDLGSDLGAAYLRDMKYALEFALANREAMLSTTLSTVLGLSQSMVRHLLDTMINENHNHAEVLKGGLVLHRKGATPALKGQFGVIPANMRDGVYVTVGLGNEEFLSSASHGAGRKMGRNAATKSLSMAEFRETMSGIVAAVDQGTLDESPMAYKPIDVVIGYQKGIVVDIVDKIAPLINVKSVEAKRGRKKVVEHPACSSGPSL